MRLVVHAGHEVADIVHEPGGGQFEVVRVPLLQLGGRLQRVLQLRDRRAGVQRPGGATGEQLHQLVDPEAGQPLVHRAILRHSPPLRVR